MPPKRAPPVSPDAFGDDIMQLLDDSILPEGYEENTITLQNVVSTANFQMPLDLRAIAWRYKSDYSPSVFAAAQIKIKRPKLTALIFETGRMVLTGSSSENVAMNAVQVFYNMLKEIHPDLLITSVQIQNIVASAQLSKYIDLEKILKAYPVSSHYSPELFPGLRFKMYVPKCKILLFVKGRIVITGCNNRESIINAYRQIISVIEPYLSTTPIEHAVIASNRAAAKKQRLEEEFEADVF